MKFSYNWLQSYIEKPLPEPVKLSESLSVMLAEVDGVEAAGSDSQFDVSILPDRACYALSHRGLAYEIAAFTGLPYRDKTLTLAKFKEELPPPDISVECPDEVLYYSLTRVDGVTQTDTPAWMKERLSVVGQKSISPTVDIVNYILFDIGQPLHVFDADLVSGNIVVRYAKQEEKFITLDGKEVNLPTNAVVIADDDGVLALAGIKGGERARVHEGTTRLLIESASFNASYIRQMSLAVGIQTDSSKRFENNITSALAPIGRVLAIQNILDVCGTDNSAVSRVSERGFIDTAVEGIPLTVSTVVQKIGVPVTASDIEKYITALRFAYEKTETGFSVTPPLFRKDIVSEIDIIEEIARLHGVNTLVLEDVDLSACKTETAQLYLLIQLLKKIFREQGFIEHYGRVFGSIGVVEVIKSYAGDKTKLRSSLTSEFSTILERNLNHLLFEHEAVKMFEIGTVFLESSEDVRVAIGVAYKKQKFLNKSHEIDSLMDILVEKLDLPLTRDKLAENLHGTFFEKDGISCVEFSLIELERIISELPRLENESRLVSTVEYFKPFSLYPRIIRDIALFTPPDTDPNEVSGLIRESVSDLCVEGPILFDVYQKRNDAGELESQSLAYRLVFQSMTETLTDEQVAEEMKSVESAIVSKNWKIR